MKKAVMYGAGNIGRGFIGKVLSDSGYQVCFLDIDEAVINEFNKKREYQVHIVSDSVDCYKTVQNVYAVGANTDAAIEEIARCDIMATAVGVNVLPHIVKNIAKGIRLRMRNLNTPLDIILAENQMNVDAIVRGWIYQELTPEERVWADKNLGLVEASIGRMVPPLTPEEKAANPTLIAVEPYEELPVDSEGFRGGIPALVGLKPFTPFSFYIKRKLFMHNMGHAVCAYLGWQKGYEYISEAIRDEDIRIVVEQAMDSIVEALHREYPQIPKNEIVDNKEDLLNRFRNRLLKDTTGRVAADPIRKLRKDDRLAGAALYCLAWNTDPADIVKGITAALNYKNENDKNAAKLQSLLDSQGINYILNILMGVEPGSKLGKMVRTSWIKMQAENDVESNGVGSGQE